MTSDSSIPPVPPIPPLPPASSDSTVAQDQNAQESTQPEPSLRERALLHLQKMKDRTACRAPFGSADQDALLEELAIHQVELQMQADELAHWNRELTEAKKVHTEFFHRAPLPMLRVGPDGALNEANISALSLIKRPPFEHSRDLRQAFEAWLEPSHRTLWQNFLKRVFREDELGEAEIVMRFGRVTPRFFSLAGHRLSENDCLVFLMETTTRRKQQAEFSLLSTIAAHPGQSSVFTDVNRRVTWVNEGFTQLTGYTEDEVLGQTLKILQGPETDQKTVERMRAALRRGEGFKEEVLNYSKDGQTYWIQLDVLPRHDEAGELCGFVSMQTEVTAYHRRNEDLRNFRKAIEQSPLGVVITDAKFHTQFANPAFEKISGYKIAEILGTPPPLLRDSHALGPTVRAELEAGREWKGVAQTYRNGGGRFYEQVLATPVLNTENEPGGYVLVKLDITEQELTRRELEVSQERYQALFESIPDAIVVADFDTGQIVDVNEQACQLFGYTREELTGFHQTQLHPPDLSDLAREQFRLSFAEEGKMVVSEWPIRRGDGSDLVVEIVSGGRSQIGQRMVAIGVFRDITERNRNQQEIERLSLIARRTANPVIFTDACRRITWVNQAFTDLTGYTLEEVIGTKPSLQQGTETDRECVARMRQALNEKRGFTEEVLNYTKTGTPYWVKLEVTPQFDSHGNVTGFLSIQTDITDIRLREKELVSAKAEADRASQAKGEFLATMSHEIRTPMNAVLGMSSLLLGTGLTPQQRRFTEVLQRNGELLLTLINDILDFSKIEAGKLALVPEPFSLLSTLEAFAQGMTLRAQEKQLEFFMEVDPGVPEFVIGDGGRILQILNNLVGNAVKFTERGSVRLRVHPELPAEGKASSVPRLVLFTITDTGIGIPAEKIHLLFTRFMQVDPGLNRRYGGTGLGLAISRELCEMMGGQIGVRSQARRGSEFWFTAHLPETTDNSAISKDGDHAGPVRLQGNVLLVEDYPANQMVAEEFLSQIGVTVHTVDDGESALVALAEKDFDLVLMDVQMPGIDGLETTRRLRDPAWKVRNTRIPVVAMTAHAMEGDRRRCLEAGMDDYLTKPIDMAELRIHLARWLPQAPASPHDGEGGGTADATVPSPQALYDRSAMLAMMGGYEEFILRFVRESIPQIDLLLTKMRQAWPGNIEEIRGHLHKLRGLGGYFCARDFERAVQDCHDEVRQGGEPREEKLIHLEQVWAKLRLVISQDWEQ